MAQDLLKNMDDVKSSVENAAKQTDKPDLTEALLEIHFGPQVTSLFTCITFLFPCHCHLQVHILQTCRYDMTTFDRGGPWGPMMTTALPPFLELKFCDGFCGCDPHWKTMATGKSFEVAFCNVFCKCTAKYREFDVTGQCRIKHVSSN